MEEIKLAELKQTGENSYVGIMEFPRKETINLIAKRNIRDFINTNKLTSTQSIIAIARYLEIVTKSKELDALNAAITIDEVHDCCAEHIKETFNGDMELFEFVEALLIVAKEEIDNIIRK